MFHVEHSNSIPAFFHGSMFHVEHAAMRPQSKVFHRAATTDFSSQTREQALTHSKHNI
jgi:hypothetical protein